MKRRGFLGLVTAVVARGQADSQQSSAPSSSGFSIAGVVVNAGTNAPIGKALVQIALTTDRTKYSTVVTGPDGRFSFGNLPAMKFALTVTRSSGRPQAYLAQGSLSSAVVTGPGQKTSELVFRFHPPGTLTGTIADESNEPVRNATVHLFAHQIDSAGMRRTVMVHATVTKASGQFRIANLTPGTYLIGVSGRPWFAQNAYGHFGYGPAMLTGGSFSFESGANSLPAKRSDPRVDVVYPFTYYSNALESASASPVAITEGNEIAVQMTLRAVPSIHVRLTGGEIRPGVGLNVQVSALGPENLPIPMNVGAFAQSGAGELSGLAPGRYQLAISQFETHPRGVQQVDADDDDPGTMTGNGRFARRIVDLTDGATVDLGTASHLSVKAVVKTVTDDRPGNRIGLLLRDSRTGTTINAMAAADSTIHFPEANLSAGRYEITLSNTPLFRILSVEAKGAKVSGGELLIEENADVQLSILIGRRSSIEVTGFAMKGDAALVGALILLLPKVAAIGATPYRDQTDSDGSFTLHGVSAGTYLALAIENGHDLAFGEPAVIRPYLAGAQAVTINESNPPPPLKLKVQTVANS